MPKMNWNDIEAKNEGAFKRLSPGGYVAVITATEPSKSGNARKFIVDIAEGDDKGYYANSQYNIDNSFFISWVSDSALGFAKGRLEKIDMSNPGFDPFAAFDADKWEMFNGKLVGIVMGEREYEKKDGTIGTGLEISSITTVQNIRAGQFTVPQINKLKGNEKPQKQNDDTASNSPYSDPFAS